MPEIHLPFSQGQHEEADARILPAGMLSSVRNMRIRKDGRLVSRWGYRVDTSAAYPGSSVCRAIETHDGAILYDQTQTIYRKIPGAYAGSVNADGTNLVSLFAGVTRYEAARNMLCQTTARGEKQDCAAVNAGTSGAHILASYDDISTGGTILLSYDRNGNLASRSIALSAYSLPILVSYGSLAYAIARSVSTPATPHLWLYVPSTRAWTSVRDLTNYNAAGDTTGDAVLGSNGIVYILIHTGATTWKLQTYNTSGGAYADLATITGITSGAAVVAIAVLSDGSLLVTANVSGTVTYERISNAGVSLSTGTLFTATGTEAAVGACTVAAYGSYWVAAVTTQKPGGGNSRTRTWYVDGGGVHAGVIYEASSLQSRPVQVSVFGQSVAYAWIADSGITWASPPAILPQATLRLVPLAGRDISSSVNASDATAMVQEAYAGTPTGGGFDCRRTIASLPAVAGDASSFGRIAHQQPIFGLPATDLVVVDYGTYADGLNGISANGQTFIAGARLFEFDGMSSFPAGLENGPVEIVATDAGSGTGVDAGTHQYQACWRAIDANGNIHRSPPSPVASVTLGVAHNVNITMPQATMAMVASPRLVQTEIYRTEAAGTVFRLVGINAFLGGTFVDSMSDATLLSQPILYTQGERGGLSGLLPNEEPPPCRYVCSGDSRLMIAGLENPNEVQWSKLFYPTEQVSWTTSEAYRRTLPEPVTGIGFLDGAWVVFTRSGIYDVTGIGPSDNGADGDFGEPRRRPADTGCISHRSIVPCSLGLLFQGTNGGMWLLPRGGNAPQWIGQPVRDFLALYPIVRDARLNEAENCAYWALTDTAGVNSFLLVYDLRTGQWYTDFFGTGVTPTTVHSLSLFGGNLLVNGTILQTPGAYVDDYTGAAPAAIVQTFTTGDIRPFGETGWGRCRMFGLLGEVRSLGTSVRADVSFDGAADPGWDDSHTWIMSSVAGSVGDEMALQFGPSRVRNCNYRIRGTVTPSGTGEEGVAFNILSLEVYGSGRLKRLPAANRG